MAEIDNVRQWKEQLGVDAPTGFDGSFLNIGFAVFSSSASGGFDVATEQQVGRGSRAIGIQPQTERWSINAYISGPDALQRAISLRAAFSLGEADYVDSWLGKVKAICTSHNFDFDAIEYDGVPFSASFDRASLPEVIDAGMIAATASDARADVIALGAALANEPGSLAQMETLRDALILEPPDLEGSEYTRQVTESLLTTRSAPTSGVPMAIQDIGSSIDSAQAGELTEASYQALRQSVGIIAVTYNSTTVLDMLEAFDLFVGELGGGALSSSRLATGETVQAIAVATGEDVDIVAKRNREAVRLWFARGEVNE